MGCQSHQKGVETDRTAPAQSRRPPAAPEGPLQPHLPLLVRRNRYAGCTGCDAKILHECGAADLRTSEVTVVTKVQDSFEALRLLLRAKQSEDGCGATRTSEAKARDVLASSHHLWASWVRHAKQFPSHHTMPFNSSNSSPRVRRFGIARHVNGSACAALSDFVFNCNMRRYRLVRCQTS